MLGKIFFANGLFLLLAFATRAGTEWINQEGRILGTLPVVTNSILFNTTNADAVVSAMQIFPVTNPWNEDVSRLPVLTNSAAMIAEIMSDLSSSRRTLIAFQEMNFVLVPDNQPLVPINFFNYPDESDLNGGVFTNATDTGFGLYPVPTNLPIEEWPSQTGSLTLQQWQMDDDGSDRHAIMVQPGAGEIFETWETLLSGTNWQASNGAIFNLNTNGLPMFPALVRYDEAERGMVEHACRIVVAKSRYDNYIYPATHFAAGTNNTSVNLPEMGQRVRLNAGFTIPANWPIEEKAVLRGLQKYGALVADNGNFFSISVTPDSRWPANVFSDFTSISITNFEIVQSTGTNGGPRSPNPPITNAGPNQTANVSQTIQLQGFIAFTNLVPVIQWNLYSGPGTVAFGNNALTNTTASFSVPGIYTLMLSANDGVHSVAYDAVTITVTNSINIFISANSTNINLTWNGGSAPYIVEAANFLPTSFWQGVVTTSQQNVSLPVTNNQEFFRVQSQ